MITMLETFPMFFFIIKSMLANEEINLMNLTIKIMNVEKKTFYEVKAEHVKSSMTCLVRARTCWGQMLVAMGIPMQ